jgi:alanine dehydrogenase
VLQLANQGVGAFKENPSLAKGLNVGDRRLVHPSVIEAFPDLAS